MNSQILSTLGETSSTLKHLQSRAPAKKSRSEKFADYVAATLEEMNESTRNEKMNLISDILFD